MILAIYGASGLGREILELAKTINQSNKRWDGFVFIDDGDMQSTVNGCRVFNYDDAKERFGTSIEIVLGIGEPAVREAIFRKVKEDGFSLPSLVHPSVSIPESTKIGNGVVIQYGCFVSCNVTIEDYVFIQPHCNVGHDDVLSEGCILSGFSNLGGNVHVGKYAYVGLSSAIKQMVSIGSYAIVGMGSVVCKDVDEELITMGNPARAMAKNASKKVFSGNKK